MIQISLALENLSNKKRLEIIEETITKIKNKNKTNLSNFFLSKSFENKFLRHLPITRGEDGNLRWQGVNIYISDICPEQDWIGVGFNEGETGLINIFGLNYERITIEFL